MAYKILLVEEHPELESRLVDAFRPQNRLNDNHNDQELQKLLRQMESSSSKSFAIFSSLNQRLDFLHWLLHQFFQGLNPQKQPSFRTRLIEDQKQQKPKLAEGSHIAPLISALYARIDKMIKELLATLRNALHERLLMFPVELDKDFDDRAFIGNLQQLADKQILPAQVLVKLIAKLNYQNDLRNTLVEVHKEFSDYQAWPKRPLNLSSGGLAFLTDDIYEKFSYVDSVLVLDGELLLVTGKILNQVEMKMGVWKTMVNFDLITEEDQKKIKYFIQSAEINEAMAWQQSLEKPA